MKNAINGDRVGGKYNFSAYFVGNQKSRQTSPSEVISVFLFFALKIYDIHDKRSARLCRSLGYGSF